MKVLALARWAENLHPFVAMLAHTAAQSADDCYELMLLVRQKSVLALDQKEKIHREDWNRLYRRPGAIQAVLVRLATEPAAKPSDDMEGEYRQKRRNAKKSFAEIYGKSLTNKLTDRERRVIERCVQRSYRKHLARVARVARGEEEPSSPDWPAWQSQPELLFFLGIFAPCMIEYKTTPDRLYREAVQGNFRALEKLIRLDPGIVSDRRIADILFRMQCRNATGHQLLLQAATKGRTSRITPATVKYLIGGFLMRMSEEIQACVDGEVLFEIIESRAWGKDRAALLKWIKGCRARNDHCRIKCRLNAPDIKALFDAAHEDFGRGRFDPDFQKNRKTIYRALSRNAALCPDLRKGNKTRAA